MGVSLLKRSALPRPAPPVADAPAADRFPAELADGSPPQLRTELEAAIGTEQVFARPIDLVRYASDASPYRLVPQIVGAPRDTADVARVFELARRIGVPVTLRSGATSLNGQAQGDGIVLDVRRHWAAIEVMETGAALRAGPGTVLGHCNRALRRHGRRVGPDPASTDFATAGGVIANNSGGMRCGVVQDAYSTLRSLEFVLPSGTTIDTADPDAPRLFEQAEPELAAGIAEIRDEIRADAALAQRIARKFEIKNTTGYRLCAFLDADEPLEIFRRLLVGSEGTLAFVSSAVFETVPHGSLTSTGLIFFVDIDAAAEPVTDLVAAGATAVELMVNPTLIAATYSLDGMPERWRDVPPEGAVLLIELRSDDPQRLDELERDALAALARHRTLEPPAFTRDHEQTEIFWRVREGMQGIVGQLRPQGSALIIEDVCVPPQRIAESARDIQALLAKHQFLTGVAGHASAGNLHFLLTPNLSEPGDRERYEAFMAELVELIVDRYDGSLKAEHGTGRNMAPYVEREWGPKATEMMWRVKALADPDGILGRDVLLSRDGAIHLRDLKSTPAIEDVASANACIECGFCEPVCPSRDLTLTPRQRIVVRREIARQAQDSPLRAALLEQFDYDGIDTCAADGSCRLACPVGIDTGKLVKQLRSRRHGRLARYLGQGVAKDAHRAEPFARNSLRIANAVAGLGGERAIAALTRSARRLAGDEHVPAWIDAMPHAAPRLPATIRGGAAAVYLPACVNRIFGRSRLAGTAAGAGAGPGAGAGASGDAPPLGLAAALTEVSARAGMRVWIPPDPQGTCCGTPWASKGLDEGRAVLARVMVYNLWRWTGHGELPVVIDATSCTHGLRSELMEVLADDERARMEQIEILDAIEWAYDRLLPALEVSHPVARAAVHPNCSARSLGLEQELLALVGALAGEVTVPQSATCCGFAGDRGMLHPELTAAATRAEAAELRAGSFDAYLCGNRTCEIGLEQATGVPWMSPIELLEIATR